MVAEEIGLNEHLEANGIEPVETDLGEYIIQLRDEPPSHIIAPAVHLTKRPDRGGFPPRRTRTCRADRDLSEPSALLDRGARRAARSASSPPTSASPAPISWSPRPAPR